MSQQQSSAPERTAIYLAPNFDHLFAELDRYRLAAMAAKRKTREYRRQARSLAKKLARARNRITALKEARHA